MPHLIYDLVPEAVLKGWLVIGQLIILLWYTSIEDIEHYLVGISLFSSVLPFNMFTPPRLICYMLLMTSSLSVPNVCQAFWWWKQNSISSSTFLCSSNGSVLSFFFQLNTMSCSTMFSISHQSTATTKHQATTHVIFLQHKTSANHPPLCTSLYSSV